MTYGNYIEIKNKKYWLFGELLNTYWNLINNKPELGTLSTSPIDKGYFANWLLLDNKLFLTDFAGSDIWCKKEYKYEDYFGAKDSSFFAFWFTGQIKIEDGKIIFSDHHFGDTKQYVFILTFENGYLLDTEMDENK